MPVIEDDGIIDIEDIIQANGADEIERVLHNELIIRPKTNDKATRDEEYSFNSFVPGTHKIFVKTWGCSHNNSDGEYMAGLLASNGYKIVNTEDEADLVVLNSCTVKNPSEDHFRNAINSAKDKNKFVVVAGCVSQATPNVGYLKNLSILGVQQIDRVVEVVEETLKGNRVRLLGKKKVNRRKAGGASLNLPKIRRNPLIEIIPISTGCLNQCTYCKTKHARGDLGSYPIGEIVNRAVEAFKEGCKEIWLTSEDTGAYGKDIDCSLPQLLYALINVIPDGCYLRLGMTNPPYIKDYLEDMGKILSHHRVYSFLHIPVQSGSDQVLSDMRREYFRRDFEDIVEYLRQRVPGITIATDIICGFPTETAADFAETLQLVAKYRFPILFINQFYPRPGTVAAKMERIPANQVRERTKKLTELFESHQPYEGRIGQIYSVLVTEESRDHRYWVLDHT
ncbi:threonylcarbamoyladenosine tRNA methylthiotransferase isoform X2 [Tetranychus urticae]|uniref:threonylcarbamoyladenosine tRNA methylthiotransferase isoform X2 n=1 Tax=Tetranychus urticae TaxID=32264 RepID=UPI000D64D8EF|nr:threonylcarbamoyladenosine tRNA methylthiotransferase isoform X2 [Tetranychus urticae]